MEVPSSLRAPEVLRTRPDVAPKTVEAMVGLTKSGALNHGTFFRAEPRFVLQARRCGMGTDGRGYAEARLQMIGQQRNGCLLDRVRVS